MSSSLPSEDFLSFSPSLLEILSFINYNDVPNCKLVNRQLSSLIQKNSLRMPRKEADMLIKNVSKNSRRGEYVEVKIMNSGRPIVVYVTESRTILIRCSREVFNYYWKNGIPSELNNGTASKDKEIRAEIRNMSSKEELEGSRSYQNNGIDDGLSTLFTVLCPRFHFHATCLKGVFPEEQLVAIGDAFRRNRCHCEVLDASQHMPGIHHFVIAADCAEIQMPSLSTDDGFLTDMREIIRWKKRIRTFFFLDEFSSLLEIGKLLQDWETGSLSLGEVELIGADERDENFSWSDQAIQHLLASLQQTYMFHIFAPDAPNFDEQYFVTRTVDNEVLRITCSENATNRVIYFKQLNGSGKEYPAV